LWVGSASPGPPERNVEDELTAGLQHSVDLLEEGREFLVSVEVFE